MARPVLLALLLSLFLTLTGLRAEDPLARLPIKDRKRLEQAESQSQRLFILLEVGKSHSRDLVTRRMAPAQAAWEERSDGQVQVCELDPEAQHAAECAWMAMLTELGSLEPGPVTLKQIKEIARETSVERKSLARSCRRAETSGETRSGIESMLKLLDQVKDTATRLSGKG